MKSRRELLDSLVQADFVMDVDGYPIAAHIPPLEGRAMSLVRHYVQLPIVLFLVHHAPVGVLRFLLDRQVFPRHAIVLRRIRGNMRSSPALAGAGSEIDRLARENYDAIARVYLERTLLTEMPPRRMTHWLARRCTISGLEHLDHAHAAGRGAVLVGLHFGSFSLLPYLVASKGYPVTYLDGTAAGGGSPFQQRVAEVCATGYDCPLTFVGVHSAFAHSPGR